MHDPISGNALITIVLKWKLLYCIVLYCIEKGRGGGGEEEKKELLQQRGFIFGHPSKY